MNRNFRWKVQSTGVEITTRLVNSRLRMDVLWSDQFIEYIAEEESGKFIVLYVRILLKSADVCYIVTYWVSDQNYLIDSVIFPQLHTF